MLGQPLQKEVITLKKYLGFGLIPQAGVAIGLTIVAASVIPEHAKVIRAVVLAATFVYEMVGPLITKMALTKAGEISPELAYKKWLINILIIRIDRSVHWSWSILVL